MTTALRQFIADDGQAWEVWDVVPVSPERRFEHPPTPPGGVERRKKPQFRVNLGKAMVNGWLIFSCGSRRRRLAPIPEKWHVMPESELRTLLASAVPVQRTTSTRGEAADEEEQQIPRSARDDEESGPDDDQGGTADPSLRSG